MSIYDLTIDELTENFLKIGEKNIMPQNFSLGFIIRGLLLLVKRLI